MQPNEQQRKMSLEEFFALLERDPEHRYELIDGYPTAQEILFIDTQVMRIQLYRRETDYWTMRNFTHDDVIELASLGIQFTVAEVYEKTTFDESFAEDWQ